MPLSVFWEYVFLPDQYDHWLFLIFSHLEGKNIFLFMNNLFKIVCIFIYFMTFISEKIELAKGTIYSHEFINGLFIYFFL